MKMLSVEQARDEILGRAFIARENETEEVDIYNCHNRVLAADIVSNIDVPPADNSAMDGYAVCTDAFLDTDSNEGLTLAVSQRITAGDHARPLSSNSAARIFTGAEIPPNANAVVMQENCIIESENQVKIVKFPHANENIRPRGQDIENGDCVARAGQKLSPQRVGLLASIGQKEISVYKPLRVSLLATGNELVEPGQSLEKGQIYNSNQAMLFQWLSALGCEITRRAIVKDSLSQTLEVLKECSEDSDLIVSSGGVSVGEEDHVKAALEELGHLHFWKVAMKPGKPLAFGSLGDALFLGLPGNPVSAFVTFMLFGVPLVKTMSGQTLSESKRVFMPVNFSSKAHRRREYCRVKINGNSVDRFSNQSSGILTSVCWADGLAIIPGETEVNPGDLVEILLFEGHVN